MLAVDARGPPSLVSFSCSPVLRPCGGGRSLPPPSTAAHHKNQQEQIARNGDDQGGGCRLVQAGCGWVGKGFFSALPPHGGEDRKQATAARSHPYPREQKSERSEAKAQTIKKREADDKKKKSTPGRASSAVQVFPSVRSSAFLGGVRGGATGVSWVAGCGAAAVRERPFFCSACVDEGGLAWAVVARFALSASGKRL